MTDLITYITIASTIVFGVGVFLDIVTTKMGLELGLIEENKVALNVIKKYGFMVLFLINMTVWYAIATMVDIVAITLKCWILAVPLLVVAVLRNYAWVHNWQLIREYVKAIKGGL